MPIEEGELKEDIIRPGPVVEYLSRSCPDLAQIDQDRCTSYAATSQLVVCQTHSLETSVLGGDLDGPLDLLALIDLGKCRMPQLRKLALCSKSHPFDMGDYTYAFQVAPHIARLSVVNCNAVLRQLRLDHVQTLCIDNTEIPLADMETLLASCKGGPRAFSGWFMSPKGEGGTRTWKRWSWFAPSRTASGTMTAATGYGIVWRRWGFR